MRDFEKRSPVCIKLIIRQRKAICGLVHTKCYGLLPVHPCEEVVESLLAGREWHLTGGEGGKVGFRPVSLNALSVGTSNTCAVVECKGDVTTVAMGRKMELGDEEYDFAFVGIDAEGNVEVFHALEEIEGELARDVVRYNQPPPLGMCERDGAKEDIANIDIPVENLNDENNV